MWHPIYIIDPAQHDEARKHPRSILEPVQQTKRVEGGGANRERCHVWWPVQHVKTRLRRGCLRQRSPVHKLGEHMRAHPVRHNLPGVWDACVVIMCELMIASSWAAIGIHMQACWLAEGLHVIGRQRRQGAS